MSFFDNKLEIGTTDENLSTHSYETLPVVFGEDCDSLERSDIGLTTPEPFPSRTSTPGLSCHTDSSVPSGESVPAPTPSVSFTPKEFVRVPKIRRRGTPKEDAVSYRLKELEKALAKDNDVPQNSGSVVASVLRQLNNPIGQARVGKPAH